MSHPNKAGSPLLAATLHHGYVALVLAAIIIILESAGWLNWLDSLSLRAATALGPALQTPHGHPASDRPIALLISDEMFEHDFAQSSPLNRGRLAELVDEIAGQKPVALGIDLDLSPGPGPEGDSTQNRLDEALARMVREGIRVVVTTPFPVRREDLLAVKYQWMKRLCQAGVQFGYPFLFATQGLVLRYPAALDSLGRQMARGNAVGAAAGAPCTLVLKGETYAAFLSKDFPVDAAMGHDALSHQRPLNSVGLAVTETVSVSSSSDVTSSGLAGRRVFLGAGFNPNDEFLTAFGPKVGVVIHAATAYSETHPTVAVSHAIGLLLDIVLGIAAGFLFHAIWGRFHQAETRASATGYQPLSRYVAARLWLLGSLIILIVWVGMLMIMSAWLLRYNLWNNPGPMIIGVFVKTLLASRAHDTHAAAADSGATIMRHADALLFVPLIAWAAYLFFSGH